MTHHSPRIIGIGTSVPPFVLTQEEAFGHMAALFAGDLSARSMDVMQQVLRHPSVRTRRISVADKNELLTLKNEDPDARVARFTAWAIRLSAEALRTALDKAKLPVEAVSALIVNTCTGYLCPGIATYLIETMGMQRNVPVYDLVGAGCGGAIPNIQLADRIVCGDPSAVVACVSVEISSATFEMDNDLGIIVSNAIFGDGAAAVIVAAGETGLSLEGSASSFHPESREYIRFVHRKGRLYNKLDAQLPKVIRLTVPPFIRDLLARHGLTTPEVGYWALHPGGDRVIGAIQEELRLTDAALSPTRHILAEYGNMSSPTVLFVLERLLEKGMEPGAWCLMAAYGAGMSIHGYLLRNGEKQDTIDKDMLRQGLE